jgi:DNA-binding phage protein
MVRQQNYCGHLSASKGQPTMALTRNFKATVMRHAQENPAFLAALLEEAAKSVVESNVETALGQLRDVVNAAVGFDPLSRETGIPKTSLMRMLGDFGNPRAANLASIIAAVSRKVGVRISVHADPEKALEPA